VTSQIISLLTAAANKYGVPPELAIAVAQQESGGNPAVVSSAGAVGVMQLMPATAAQLGVTDPTDPTQNIDGGVRYLSQMLSEFNGDPQLALAAYNWGPGNVSKNGYANWPPETTNYVSSIWSQVSSLLTPAATPALTSDSSDAEAVDDSGDDYSSISDSGLTSDNSLVLLVAGGGIIFYALSRLMG
jgi:soluble lytic murein transglycosylase-like protein